MSPDANRAERTGYELIDAGDGRRLERFGARVVDRPAATAAARRMTPGAWAGAELQFEPGAGWDGPTDPWAIEVSRLTLELRPTASGGLGFYPEHEANIEWLASQVLSRARVRQPSVLNLVGHTGLATLAAARAGAAVVHVDAARSAVAWARRNADQSGLVDRPIRWLVDHASAFTAREARRGRRYEGIVLDPPSFGRAGTRRWRLDEELPALLASCRAVAADDAFVLLTGHTTGISGDDLAEELDRAFGSRRRRAAIEVRPLALDATSGARLELGWAARLPTRRARHAANQQDGTRDREPGKPTDQGCRAPPRAAGTRRDRADPRRWRARGAPSNGGRGDRRSSVRLSPTPCNARGAAGR